jgi:hypothetical protein
MEEGLLEHFCAVGGKLFIGTQTGMSASHLPYEADRWAVFSVSRSNLARRARSQAIKRLRS